MFEKRTYYNLKKEHITILVFLLLGMVRIKLVKLNFVKKTNEKQTFSSISVSCSVGV